MFDTTNETITDCINLALAGTGWIVGTCDVTRRRTVRKTNSSSWDIIQEARKVYRCELEFDTLNKKVNIYEKRGIDKGVYFLDSLNLKDLSVQSDSYDFYTRIIAKGKDNLKVTLENFQYSNKIKTYIWKDERYTNIESLTEDAEAKLDELSKPYRAYSATIIDLANISKEDYKDILSYNLGDVITLVSKENEIKEKQRIVKMVEYPDEPDRNTCEIANTTLSFEDVQKEFQDTSDTVNNITTDNGTVDGSKINGISTEQIYDFEASVGKITDLTIVNARIDELYANKANISELNVVIANVAELNATKANITDLNTINANIQNLIAADATINNALIGKADITELNAVKGTIISLDSKIANIETLVNGNLSSENIQAGGITSDKLTIANGFITNAMIASLDVAKINAGDISTNKFRIVSDNGGIEIVGATQQFKDKNNKVRIQMGQDATGNFNFILRGEDGTTTLIDHTGIKEKAIADNLIKENMVAADAIGEKQINYSSLITGLNKDTNTQLIKASKVAIDLAGQTLEVAFNSLKTNVDSKETRNLFVEKNTVDGYYNDTGFVNASSYRTSDYIEVNEGEIYTLCKFAADGYHRIVVFDKDKNRLGARLVETDMVLKYTIRSSVKYIRVSIENTHKYKVEKGENPNPVWTAAPEDIDSSIETVKQITESNSTTINVMQGQIATAINNTQIVKDGQTILLKDDYNRTVATVNSINSTIGTHTTKINELTGSITSVDTKVNSVQRDLEGTKSTVSSHTSQINGLNSTVGTQGSSINQLKNEISLKVEQTDINNAVTSLKIGGDNILRNGNFAYSMSDWSVHDMSSGGTSKSVDVENGGGDWKPANKKVLVIRGTNTTNRYGVISSTIKLIPKTKYTISGYCAGHRVNKIQVNVRDRQGSDANIHTIDINPVSGGSTLDKWCRFETTFTTTSNTDFALNLYSVNFADNGYVWFCDVQIQQGTKASAWIPCSADIDNSISNVQTQVTTTNNKVASIETNLNGITQRVSSTESTISTHTTQLGTVDNRINTAKNAAISAAATDATSKANNAQSKALADAKSYTNGQITTVNKTITDKVAEIKTTTDSITQRVSSAETKVNTVTANFNNLQVGGTNLATETNKGATGWGWSLQTGGKTATEVTENGIRCCKLVRDSVVATGWSYISYNRIGRDKYLPNRKYTVSFEVKASVVTSFYVGLKEGNSGNPLTGDTKTGNTVANTWTKLSATITTLSKLPSSTSQVLYLNGMNSGTGVTYIFRNLKIEEGTKESNWSPAPEDIDSSISNVQRQVTTTNNKVASIETNLNGITQRVSSTESTVSTHTTQLGTVDSRINTAKNAAISTAASDATTKANNAQSKALADAKSYTNGQITTVNKTITDKVAEIKTTTDSITQRVSSTESTTSTLTTKVNTAQSTADSKAKVFTSTPTVPYKVGDLWTGGPSGDVMRCKVARTSGNYTASDWEKASKYTDDTKANAAQSTANTANATANANKTEITSTKNKVSTIETNLNSITSKVSSAEKNITTINGNITSLQNRMSSAEQKITSSAIISTVQSTINTAKNEAINSANSSTDNKLKSYATTSSLTQTANNITASFKSSGGFNLLKNSDAKNGSSYWVSNGGGLSITTAGINPFIGEKEFKTTFPSGMAYYTSVRLKSNTDYVYEAWIYTNTAITSNSLTPLHFWCSSTADTSGQSQCTVIDYRQTLTVNAYTKVYVHFRTKSGNVFFKPFIYSSATSGMICVKQISLSEGTIESAWTPHPDEVYSGSTMIDANGVTINNGALTVKNKSGSTVLSGDSNGNLNLYAVGSKFKFTATGQRVTEMYSDASGNGDVFTIKVPFYNKDSGFRLCTDTGVNLIEAYAKNGDVHRLKLHGFQTDNIKATYMVASKQLYRYDDSGIYWKPIYTRNENAGIKMIDKLGIVNKSSGGLYMQVDMDGGGAYGIDIWSSDINLKKNIRELNSKIKPLSLQEDTITGLELIKKIKHYEFDYDETKGFEGHIDCGYISQQLQEINSSFVTEVEQEDGTILLQPLASALLPHITKAMQQQQEKIEELENIILELKSRIGA